MGSLTELISWFSGSGSALVALSGGVDSAVVALAAQRALGKGALAVTADYRTLAAEELATARRVADEIGISHRVVQYDELQNQEFVKNDKLRCYHCRTELGEHLIREANRAGIRLIVDGTNVDDLSDYRPGIRALREHGVRSPMVELGIDKAEVRQIARECGLSVYDRPSNACLASRIPAGTEVTYEKLRRIESSEIAVKAILGVRQLRVRDHGELARIEVGQDEMTKIFDAAKIARVDDTLKQLGYRYVAFDAGGYRASKLPMAGDSRG